MSKFSFQDVSDNMAGENYRSDQDNDVGMVISIQHVPSGQKVEFKAFIETFEDAFASNWSETEVFGRMDQIQSFKNTTRTINLSWAVPSHSQEEAISNLRAIQSLASFMYPVYEPIQANVSTDNSQVDANSIQNSAITARRNLLQSLNNEDATAAEKQSFIQFAIDTIDQEILGPISKQSEIVTKEVGLISSPPILKLKFMNLANDSHNNGLYGRASGFTFSPDFENGASFLYFEGTIVPTLIKCSMTFTVIHSDKLGFDQDKKNRTDGFPYNI